MEKTITKVHNQTHQVLQAQTQWNNGFMELQVQVGNLRQELQEVQRNMVTDDNITQIISEATRALSVLGIRDSSQEKPPSNMPNPWGCV